MKDSSFLCDGPEKSRYTIVLAHGAGAPMDSEFLTTFALGLGARGFKVIRFEFTYMRLFTKSGKRRLPSQVNVLKDEWKSVLCKVNSEKIIIGGKSMGGRVASIFASEEKSEKKALAGLVCLGYPFHPKGKPQQLRISHFNDINIPMLICQGERDELGSRDEVRGYSLPTNISIHWLRDGNHSFLPRKASGTCLKQNYASALSAIEHFVCALDV